MPWSALVSSRLLRICTFLRMKMHRSDFLDFVSPRALHVRAPGIGEKLWDLRAPCRPHGRLCRHLSTVPLPVLRSNQPILSLFVHFHVATSA